MACSCWRMAAAANSRLEREGLARDEGRLHLYRSAGELLGSSRLLALQF